MQHQLAHPSGLPQVRLADLRTAPRNAVVRVPLFSPALGLRRWCGVWLAEEFEPKRRFPVVYLFRGHHSEWFNPEQDSSRLTILSEQVRLAIEAGELPPMALVYPCFAAHDNTFQTLGADWVSQHLCPRVPGVGLGRFETHFIEEVVPRLESALELEEPHRIGIGFSLGGLNVFNIAFRHPGLFLEVAAYDGSFFHDPPRRDDSILNHPMFDPVFGKPRVPTHVKTHSPLWLARNLPYMQLERSRYYIQSGPEAAEPHDSNFERTKLLIDALAERHLKSEFPQVVEDGHHDWFTADRFAMTVLRHALK